MAISRYDGNLEAFAQNAQSGERTVYGSETVSDSLDDNINDEFKRGWGIVSDNDAPTMEDYNGAMFTHGQLLAYLHQVGVAEWNGAQVYAENGFVNYDGAIYRCKTADHSGVSTPDVDTTNWQLIIGADGLDNTVSKDTDTGGAFIPTGTTAQRPSTDPAGAYTYLRHNTEIDLLESSGDGSNWTVLNNAGNKNLIINGGFDVWQRGTSFNAQFDYTADRWAVWAGNGVTNISKTREAFTLGQTEVDGNPKYFLRIDQHAASTTNPNLQNKIEDVTTASGQTVTLSFWAKADLALDIDVIARQVFGSGGSSDVYTSFTNNLSLTTSWTKYTYTVDIPSVAGKTVGDGNCLAIQFDLRAGSTAIFDIAQVQLELGSTATDFEYRSYGEELLLCQRYYQRVDYAYLYANVDSVAGSVTRRYSQPLRPELRADGTVTIGNSDTPLTSFTAINNVLFLAGESSASQTALTASNIEIDAEI